MKWFFLFFICIGFKANAQIISQFDWDSNPVTTAVVGPNATSVSSSATSDINGVGGTNGLNASLPKLDIDFDIPGSPTFDVDGIDISIDYQRDESVGEFFTRGSSLVLTGGNQLRVSYRVDDGSGGFNTVSSGAVYNIPNDNTFRTYRFYYLPTTGEGVLLVDGVQQWTNNGPDNRNLYWTGSGDVRIGNNMDGSGSNRTFFDNLIVGSIINSALPIKLKSFDAKLDLDKVILFWETASEFNNDYFEVEKSVDGENWVVVSKVIGAGNSYTNISYQSIDHNLYVGLSYYRLKQVDFNGDFSYSDIVAINYQKSSMTIFPNPTNASVYIKNSISPSVKVFNSIGVDLTNQAKIITIQDKISIDLSNMPTGLYYLKIGTELKKVIKI